MITISDFRINSENTLVGYAYVEDIFNNGVLANGSFTILNVLLEYGSDSSAELVANGAVPTAFEDYVTLDSDGRTVEIELPLDTIESALGYHSIYRVTIKAAGSNNEEYLLSCGCYPRTAYAIAYNKCLVGKTLLNLLKGGVCDNKDLNKIVNVLALEHMVEVLDFTTARKIWSSFYANNNMTTTTSNCGCNA